MANLNYPENNIDFFEEGGTGIGALPFAVRSNDSKLAIFTSLLERDNYYTAHPVDIAAGTDLANRQAAIGIGPSDGDPVGVTAAFIRNEANDNWVAIATNFVGSQGPKGDKGDIGPAGADGVRRSFPSETARNSFYATQLNRDDLSTGDIISVNMGSNLVEFQQWVGANQPTSYDPNDFVPTSISTANASISFGQELRIFDFGEFAAYVNEIEDKRSISVSQPYTDVGGSQKAQQLSFPGEATLFTTTGTTNSASQQVHEYTFDTTGVITSTAILLQGTINFVVAPQFYILEAWIGTDDTGTRVFRDRFNPGGTAGLFNARPESPQRFEENTTYFIRLTGDAAFQYVVGDNPGDAAPVGTGTGFQLTTQDLATEEWVNSPTPNIFHDNLSAEIQQLNVKSLPVGDDILLIEDSGDAYSKKRILLSSLSNVLAPVPSLHNFTIDIPSRVDLNTDLNTARTINFDVSNFSQLTALTLIVTTGDDKTITTPTSDGLQSESVTLSGISTASAGSVTFQLSGTTATGTVTSNIVTVTIANLSSTEQAYYGSLSSIDGFSTVDIATLTAVDVSNSGTTYNVAESVANNNYFGILSPDDRDPVSIFNTISNRFAYNPSDPSVTSSFTLATAVRTIDSRTYNLLTTQNLSGFTGTFNYRIVTE